MILPVQGDIIHAYLTHLNMILLVQGDIACAYLTYTGLILGLRPANERRRYKVTPSFIGWAQT